MTKCIVIGKEPKEEKKLKPIEFIYFLSGEFRLVKQGCLLPKEYKNIELISINIDGMDYMFAYDTYRENGSFYLGHWNDGIV